MTTKYRPEVDGLRAVAVIPVILFHAGFEWVSGGYVGVDVFFVVSGYLITSIIYGEILKGSFSIVHFYERRARRILPALFFVTLICLIVAWFWMLPEEFESLSESLIAVNLFVSNIYFWQALDYFAGPAEMQPFLHTWSLAVEEQFYLFFPLFMLIVARFRYGMMLSIIALGLLASLSLAQYGANHHSTANFYLLPTRAWELLAGCLIAIYMHDHRIARSSLVSRLGGSIGLVMILYAAITFDKTTPFPSLWTLIPVSGASLVILFANGNDVAGRLLSWKPVVGVGLISYSAYLWHQPVFVFAKERSLGPVSDGLLLWLSVLSILLAWFSWRFVEQPFRNRRNFTRAQIFKTALATSCLMIGIGTYGLQAQGIPWRFGEDVERIVNVRMTNSQVPEECNATEGRFLRIDETCEYNENGEKVVAIWGDSHATPLVRPVANRVETLGMRVKMLVYTNCLPIAGITRFDEPDCGKFNDQVMDYLLGNDDVELVIMMGRFPLQIEGEVFDNGEGGIEDGRIIKAIPAEQESVAYRDDERIDIVGQRLVSTIDRLVDDGKRVVLFYPVPEVGWDVPYLLAKERIYGIERQAPLSTNFARYKERVASSYRQLSRVEDHLNILKMEPSALLCDTYLPGRCATHFYEHIFYYDDNHLSVLGSSMLVDQMFREMRNRGWMNEQQLKLTQLGENDKWTDESMP
ncbi:acyltransferase family protein [Halomonas maura]|uniref:acyltransferase family protein n=1 Tax=Halomonas maura TaxID=117606 RepID=UPI0025B560F5|nr:acyltransferase family protein [Halomonas maura]MDN3555277.1 acyltransferase family protein [Halomonas maura]